MSLVEGLQSEMNRVREIITEYESLPKNAGMLVISMMKASIKNAERTIATGDTIEMMKAYKDLQEYSS